MQRKTLVLCSVVVLLLGAAVVASAQEIDDPAIFELEGNATNDAPAGDDWQNLITNGGSSLAFTGILADPGSASQFTSGGSKDDLDISSWRHKDTGGFPDKDDITNAYAAGYNLSGDLVIYFGADRYANNGDAQLGFWFLQDDVYENNDGTFHGVHHIGDILILAHFSNGGGVPTIEVFQWVGTGGDTNGTLDELMPSGSAKCGTVGVDTSCAITNETDVPLYWSYTPKFGTSGTAPPVSFFEGAVNVTELLGGPGNVPCFTSFLAETRSSTSIDATLKDYVLGGFPVCGLELTKSCDSGSINSNGDALTYAYSGTVTNVGFGTLYNVTVVDDAGTPGEASDDITHNIGSLGPGSSDTFSGTFDSLLNPATNRASASGNTASDGTGTDVTADADPAVCPSVPISPQIDVSKNCDLHLEVIGGQVVLRVDFGGQVCNIGDPVGISNVAVVDDSGTSGDTSDDQTVLSGVTLGTTSPSDCASFTGSYYPSSSNSTDPSAAVFSDTVSASGDANLGGGPVSDTATAECPLCPCEGCT